MVIYTKRKKRKKAPVIITIVLITAALAAVGCFIVYPKVMQELYPLRYTAYVTKYADENGLSRSFVYAVIHTESKFDAAAHSDADARGLMQITEETFDWIRAKRGDKGAVYYDMYNAQKNIEYGCWFLGYLYREFGSYELAAAAYHAGRGKVNQWLSDSNYSPDGKTLSKIPGSGTAHYVDKIMSAKDTYENLYKDEI